jgi:hypothetical protein
MARKTALKPVSVGGIEFDAMLSEDVELAANIPSYPTEKGFSVSDSVILEPRTLSMTLYLTDTPVTFAKKFGRQKNRASTVAKKLEKLYFSKKPVKVVTSTATYENMCVTSVTLSRSPDVGRAREIPISFTEVRVAKPKATDIPDSYGRGGETAAYAGAANTKASATPKSSEAAPAADDGKKGSILYNIATSAGLLGGESKPAGGGIGGLLGGLGLGG